jgi:RNA polymerase sigma-70 factor (ECF subfamily)
VDVVELGVDPCVHRLADPAVLATAHDGGTRPAPVVIPLEWSTDRGGFRGVSGTPVPTDGRRSEAFATYVVPELEVLLRVARTLVPRPADAEDLVQDTLVRAFRAIDSFDGRHPRAWLLTIMRNAQVNRTRRRRPELLHDPDATLERIGDSEHAGDSPEVVVVGAAFDSVVADALDALPGRFRQVVELVDIEGLTYAEAAEAAGVPVGTVMSRLHRARTRIRDRLAAAGLAPRRGEG